MYLVHPTIGFVRKGGQTTRKILVVDDESHVCFMLKEVLSEDGFVVDSYKDPLLALSNFKADSYSLVILDIRMPGLNGFALYREIRRLDKKVKICFLTAGEMYYGYSDIFSSVPAKCFIRKPIDNEELMKRINEIILDETASLKQATWWVQRSPIGLQYLYHPVVVKDKQRFWKRILIVDDNEDVTTTFKAVIEGSNNDVNKKIEVYALNNPVEALSEFKPNFYDLLLVDINMPYMNGFEFCDKVLAIDINVKICFMSSGEINRKALREIYPSLTVGCFIRKPVPIDYLVKHITSELD